MFWLENIGGISKIPQKTQKVCFQWELPNCFACQSEKEIGQPIPFIVSSPWFSAFGRKWRIALVRNRRSRTEFVGLFLWMMPCMKTPNITAEFSLFNCNGGVYRACNGSLDYTGSFGSWDFLMLCCFLDSRDVISRCGVLRFSCLLEDKTFLDLRLSDDSESDAKDELDLEIESDEECEKTDQPEPKGVDRLVKNLKRLLQDEQSSDVLLKIEDREFKAHKAILKVRSPVFESMFQPNTKESITGVADIPDISASAFEVFLLYIYTGSTDTISSDNITDLYYAADKYEINDLKSECVEFMENNLSVDNFCDVMTLSLQHSELSLQETATQFFCENVKRIIKTVQWQKYMKDYTTQANELYIKAINA